MPLEVSYKSDEIKCMVYSVVLLGGLYNTLSMQDSENGRKGELFRSADTLTVM